MVNNFAKHLIEAMPYIEQFQNKIFVVKMGGAIMEDQKKKASFVKDLALLSHIGIKIVLVHGGGKQISKYLDQMNIENKFIDGYRVTSKEAINIVEMVLSGQVNKNLSYALQTEGINSIGISGKDNGLIKAQKKKIINGQTKVDLGHVGEIIGIDTSILEVLLKTGYVPVISPVGCDKKGNTLNINADDVAAAICSALKAEKLFLMTDVKGLYKEFGKETSFVSRITVKEINEFIESGDIHSGMIPKLKCCVSSLEAGSQSVHILSGLIEHSLLLEIFSDQGVGTLITKGVS